MVQVPVAQRQYPKTLIVHELLYGVNIAMLNTTKVAVDERGQIWLKFHFHVELLEEYYFYLHRGWANKGVDHTRKKRLRWTVKTPCCSCF